MGAGGTGKSAMVHELREQMEARKCGNLVVTAYTGVAAAPFGGATLLSLLNLGIASKQMTSVRQLSAEKIATAREKFRKECGFDIGTVGGIVVDEVSFNIIGR